MSKGEMKEQVLDLEQLKKHLKSYPDFPKEGILFQDIFPLFKSPQLINSLLHQLLEKVKTLALPPIDVVVGLDARGFLFGPLLALNLNCAFVPVRKKGKLPGQTIEVAYEKEYGTDYFEMQKEGIDRGQRVLIVDDLLATGGSAWAAQELVHQLGGNVLGFLFVIELTDLKGSDKLCAPVASLFQFSD